MSGHNGGGGSGAPMGDPSYQGYSVLPSTGREKVLERIKPVSYSATVNKLLLDVEADTKGTVEDMEVEADAVYMARSMEPQKLVGYARTLGINVDRSMYEIKHDVMSFAKENPSVFLKSIDDPRTERKQVVLDAIDYGILDFSHHANEINWVMGTKRPTIMHTPVGVEKLDYFVEYTFDSEGEDVYKEIQKKMKKMDSIDEEVEIPEIKEVVMEEEIIVKKKPTSKKVK